MDPTWSTIEFIGEKNFSNICQELRLEVNEVGIVRRILRQWDSLMAIPDPEQRQIEKMRVAVETIKNLPPEQRGRILEAQLRVNILLIKLRAKKQ